MNANDTQHRLRRIAGLASAAAAGALLLACHSGTPAAPEGTEIALGCEFLTSDPVSGNFEARVNATVIDADSDVPQVGVGVFFRVQSGSGVIETPIPVVTNNAGHAEAILRATGATQANPVTVRVSSGPIEADLQLDVRGCFGSTASPPEAALTLMPATNHMTNQTITADVGASTDEDCPDDEPDRWTITWGDGAMNDGRFNSSTQAQHAYATAGMYTITATVVDCTGLTDTFTQTITVQ